MPAGWRCWRGGCKRADLAIEAAVDRAEDELAAVRRRRVSTPASYAQLPAEIALRLLGRAVARVGDEGPVELAKLEALEGRAR